MFGGFRPTRCFVTHRRRQRHTQLCCNIKASNFNCKHFDNTRFCRVTTTQHARNHLGTFRWKQQHCFRFPLKIYFNRKKLCKKDHWGDRSVLIVIDCAELHTNVLPNLINMSDLWFLIVITFVDLYLQLICNLSYCILRSP